jgi:hypothetical protein
MRHFELLARPETLIHAELQAACANLNDAAGLLFEVMRGQGVSSGGAVSRIESVRRNGVKLRRQALDMVYKAPSLASSANP